MQLIHIQQGKKIEIQKITTVDLCYMKVLFHTFGNNIILLFFHEEKEKIWRIKEVCE